MRQSTVPAALSRRSLLTAAGATAAGMLAGAGAVPSTAAATPPALDQNPTDAAGAWRKLQEGNARFAGGRQIHPHQQLAWRQTLLSGQQPFACVLGCADSRVPPELVFDHGLGDLFTVRAIGEVLDDAVVGSIEYAVEHLHVPLVVVLGHAGCGAVKAAIELVRGGDRPGGAVNTVARAIEATVRATEPDDDEQSFLAACVTNQAGRVAVSLRERSVAIGEAAGRGEVEIVAATYDLKSGRVAKLRSA
jgi:carbonic anhydrase